MKTIGFTSTIPVEALLAANIKPVDLNNQFITSPNPARLIAQAEAAGIPPTVCSWVKGLYGAVMESLPDAVINVAQGDCTVCTSMCETLDHHGIPVFYFSFPKTPDHRLLKKEIERLCAFAGTTYEQAQNQFDQLRALRKKLKELDELTWEGCRVTGFENHFWLVSSTDFDGDPAAFERRLDHFLEQAKARPISKPPLRVAYAGVPPISPDIYTAVQRHGGSVIYNEVQRQFAMLGGEQDLAREYSRYTYPYGIKQRLPDISTACTARSADCLILYTQTFCHQAVEALIIQKTINTLPMLCIECDSPGPLDKKTSIRIESFLSSVNNSAGFHEKRTKNRPKTAARVVGIDIGSRFTKIVFHESNQPPVKHSIPSIDTYDSILSQKDGLIWIDKNRIAQLIGIPAAAEALLCCTGYGRNNTKAGNAVSIPELQAHMLGVCNATGKDSATIVDIGGQDTKIMNIEAGRIAEFYMNQKCAAGSGRFVENAAQTLGCSVKQLITVSIRPDFSSDFDFTCATFAESDIVECVSSGMDADEIARHIMFAIFTRVKPIIDRYYKKALILSGGLGSSTTLSELFRSHTDYTLIPLKDPQFMGADGCCNYVISSKFN